MSTIMGNARLFRDNPFDQSMAPTEDYDLWARLAAAGVHLSNLSESLVRYRIHPMQASQQKSLRLDQLARKIRSIYCARLIGATALASRMDSETLDLADLLESAKAIAEFCAADPEFSTLEFRFMMAWIYQKLQSHNIRHWWTWLRIQDKLGWRLDSNYRLNVALLAVLPRWATRSFFDTLVKLKR